MLTFAAHEKLRGFIEQLSFNRPCEIANPQLPQKSMENMLIARTDTQDIHSLAVWPRLTHRSNYKTNGSPKVPSHARRKA